MNRNECGAAGKQKSGAQELKAKESGRNLGLDRPEDSTKTMAEPHEIIFSSETAKCVRSSRIFGIVTGKTSARSRDDEGRIHENLLKYYEYIANPTPQHGVSNVRKSDTPWNSRTWIGKPDTSSLLGQKIRHARSACVAWHGITSLLMQLPRLLLLPTFSPPPCRAMAALAALLAHLPDTVLEQFRDASFTANFRMRNAQLFSGTSWVDLDDLLAWLRQRGR
ncbi:hypothetical protein B0H11DRAFT_2194866 [Mycena galericulata]|nr:hypothetical protein B0H11DRAFT_2194866 [Mycena galericulata]